MISVSLYNGHNACICIMKDDEILLNWELERFTRIKHDYGFNMEFLLKSLDLCNITSKDIDIIITNNCSYGRSPPWACPSTANDRTILSSINVENFNCPMIAMNHHLCHVASAYYTSPFDNATIITQDGGGDDENYSVATADGNFIKEFNKSRVTNIAGWWSGITLNNYRMKRLHAWDPGSGAGKIMALAAYGNANDDLEKQLENNMNQGIKPHYTDPHSRAFNNDEDLSDTDTQRSRDVAASLQNITEKKIKIIYDSVYQQFPNENLCIAGGIALNCVANTKIKSEFKNLHVPPFPNDTGLAVGMGLFYWHHMLNNPKTVHQNKYFSPYTGPKYTKKEIDDILKSTEKKYKCEIKKDNISPNTLADIIIDGYTICIWKGRSESGPRALGHRSIICLPSIESHRNYLNSEVKNREMYRPYAPIILDKYVFEVLEDYLPWSPYMSISGTIKKEWRDKMAACNHIDNSTRPQIISRNHDHFIYSLIECIYKKTGIPAILNTSFNMQEPIVETPIEAINTFFKFPIKYLFLENALIIKHDE